MGRKCGRVLRILSLHNSFTINNLYARRSILPFLLVVCCYKFNFTLQYLWSLNLDSWSQQKHQDATVWWAEAHSLVAQSSRAWGWWASVPPLIHKQECQWCSRHDKDAVIYCCHLLDLQEHREVSQWEIFKLYFLSKLQLQCVRRWDPDQSTSAGNTTGSKEREYSHTHSCC